VQAARQPAVVASGAEAEPQRAAEVLGSDAGAVPQRAAGEVASDAQAAQRRAAALLDARGPQPAGAHPSAVLPLAAPLVCRRGRALPLPAPRQAAGFAHAMRTLRAAPSSKQS
jgi:hypothetical protein